MSKNIFILYLIISSSLMTLYVNCSFQTSLFTYLNKKNIGKNLTISPLSIFQALSLTANGAQSNTLSEMLSILQSPNTSSLNEINQKIIKVLKHISSVEIANAIMTKFEPLSDFMSVSKKLNVEVSQLKSVRAVNNWCDQKTHGKIKKIVDKLEDNILMLILNAIYFKGQWVEPFEKDFTVKMPFYNFNIENKKEQFKIESMKKTFHFSYYENNDFQSIRLPYVDDNYSTYALIILPKEKVNINEFIEKLDKDNIIKAIINNFSRTKVHLQLPKFEIEYSESLKGVLGEMGMKTAFSNLANFSGIRRQNDLKIDDVVHKTYLKINEKGTEAAAVTMVSMMYSSAAPIKKEKIVPMIVNRPFLFLIINGELPEDHDILFISKIETLK